MVKHFVHLFVLPIRALVMVVATLPTGHACGGPVTGKACPVTPSAHHRVLHAGNSLLAGRLPSAPVSWRVAPTGLNHHQR
jgi:hypothetical protein